MKTHKLFFVFTFLFSVFLIQPVQAIDFFPVAKTSEATLSGSPKGVVVGNFKGDSSKVGFVAISDQNKVFQLDFSNNMFIPVGMGTDVGNVPTQLAAGQFNTADMKLDLVVANSGDSNLETLLSDQVVNGLLSFNSVAIPDSSTAVDVVGILTADFNNDGKTDLYYFGYNGGVRVAFGDGDFDGTQGFDGNLIVKEYYGGIGDFNNDSNIDIINGVSYTNDPTSDLLDPNSGNGMGTVSYDVGTYIYIPQNPRALRVADFNGDGKQDLILVTRGANQFHSFLGNGDFTFNALAPVPTCVGPSEMAVADFNGDSKLDAAVICDDGKLNILTGDGAGNFINSGYEVVLGNVPFAVVSGDFNNDGSQDLLVSVSGDNKVVTLLGNPAPTLSSPVAQDGLFQITYTDANNEAPNPITVTIDGVPHTLVEVDATDTDYTNGKVYQVAVDLESGDHTYQFAASDGTSAATGSPDNSVLTQQTLSVAPASGGCSLNSTPIQPSSLLIFLSALTSLLFLRARFLTR